MKKRVFLIHGWDGSPTNCWFPWLKKKLEENDFAVFVPIMPDTSHPKIEEWVNHLNDIVGEIDNDTYFIGHSIGCQTILRYLSSLSSNSIAGGAVFVAGFFNLQHLETEEEKIIAEPWLKTEINFDLILMKIKRIVAIFSDDDPDVDLSEKEIFKNSLNAEIIIEHAKGHFSDDANIKELPSVPESLLKISSF